MAVEDDLVTGLPPGVGVFGFAAGLGFDGEYSGGGENDVIDIPRLFPGFDDSEIMEDADRVGRETVENQANDLLTQQAQAAIPPILISIRSSVNLSMMSAVRFCSEYPAGRGISSKGRRNC